MKDLGVARKAGPSCQPGVKLGLAIKMGRDKTLSNLSRGLKLCPQVPDPYIVPARSSYWLLVDRWSVCPTQLGVTEDQVGHPPPILSYWRKNTTNQVPFLLNPQRSPEIEARTPPQVSGHTGMGNSGLKTSVQGPLSH